MHFTGEEFHTMVHELLYAEPASFDMLCRIAEKSLRPSVNYWCGSEDCLRGRNLEDDLMQEIYLRLMKTTVHGFLLRKDVEGAYNDDPEGFAAWMYQVAKNMKRDLVNRVRGGDFRTDSLDDHAFQGVSDDEAEDAREREERLAQAVSIVLSADAGIHKVLTWLAQLIFILQNNITKIESNRLLIASFENKTLYEMYDMILLAARDIPWFVVTENQNGRIMAALRKKRRGGCTYGETKYREFFMSHNGVKSGKKSVSDWVNRMNSTIQRNTLGNAGEKCGTPSEKRRGSDEASNG